jgi:uncharacterized membrane protein
MRINNALIIAMMVVALVGFTDSAFLTAEHVRGVIPPCSLSSCEQVLNSRFAAIGAVPVSAAGVLFYGAVIVLLVMYFDSWDRRLLHGVSWMTVAGFLGTLYFFSVQVFVLHAICEYCMVSAFASLTLVVMGGIIMRKD